MHTFLLREGRWTVSGETTDQDGKRVAIEGETLVRHGASTWINAGWMRLPDGTRYENAVHVVPIAGGASATRWTAINPILGVIDGHLAVIDDTLLLSGAAADGIHSTVESMVQVSDGEYRARGCLYRGDAAVSQWSVALRRVAEAA
jgi:hypothetical protein